MNIMRQTPTHTLLGTKPPERRLLVIILALLLLAAGCGSPSSFGLDVELEHFCKESRYLTMSNSGTKDVSLEGWTIEAEGFTYTLPRVVVAPGESLRAWSGTGTNDRYNIYIGRPVETWDPKESLSFRGPPSLFGSTIVQFFLSCTEDLAP
jgi:hypothetical protein